jgi:hypothetical protein
MSTPLADALLTIGEHPLCSTVELQQSDDLALWFHIKNDQNDDYADTTTLATTLASYDETGAAYRLTVLLPVLEESIEPEGWQSPTIDERNSLALAYA